MFSVDPTQRGGGIGTTKIEAAEDHAGREWDVPVMQMTVIDVRDDLQFEILEKTLTLQGLRPESAGSPRWIPLGTTS